MDTQIKLLESLLSHLQAIHNRAELHCSPIVDYYSDWVRVNAHANLASSVVLELIKRDREAREG